MYLELTCLSSQSQSAATLDLVCQVIIAWQEDLVSRISEFGTEKNDFMTFFMFDRIAVFQLVLQIV